MDLSKISVTISFHLSTTFSASSTHSSAQSSLTLGRAQCETEHRSTAFTPPLQSPSPPRLTAMPPAAIQACTTAILHETGRDSLAATHLLTAKMDSAPFLFRRKLEIVNTQEQCMEYSLGSTLLPSFLLFKTFSSGQSLKELRNFPRGN